MVNIHRLPDLGVEALLNLPEVISAKERIYSLSSGSIYFSIVLEPSI